MLALDAEGPPAESNQMRPAHPDTFLAPPLSETIRNAWAIARVDHRTFLGSANCGDRAAGANKEKTVGRVSTTATGGLSYVARESSTRPPTRNLRRSFNRHTHFPPALFHP